MKILKIGAVWCSGCLVMRPRWQEIENQNPFLETEYYEFDDHPEIAQKYNITNGVLPVFIFLDKDGNELDRFSGEVSVAVLKEAIAKFKDK